MPMKTIQITIDEPLLDRLDQQVRCSGKARSAFIRTAIARELRRLQIAEMDRRHAEAYRLHPPDEEELSDWESVQAWPDDDWPEA